MINQDIIAQDLFYKIRSRFPKMEMGNEQGQSTFEASKGRFFDFDAIFNENNLGTVSISINEPGSLKLYFNKNILEYFIICFYPMSIIKAFMKSM
jgi:hypothetical protein